MLLSVIVTQRTKTLHGRIEEQIKECEQRGRQIGPPVTKVCLANVLHFG
jgi:hypothetical protein